MKILVLNAGSSSQKSCLYELMSDRLPDRIPEAIWQADIDWSIASDQGKLTVKTNRHKREEVIATQDRSQSLNQLLNTLISGSTKVLDTLSDIDIVGHRVVHGGAHYSQPTLITPDVKQVIAQLIPLAPAHHPAHLAGIEAIEKSLGDVPQLAVFDTAFHCQMPPAAKVYPVPYDWFEQGIQRYGFHGISHEFCAQRAAELLQKPLADLKLVTCHLGNGCSLTAIAQGHSIDTTMGFTPLEGVMMGARSGSIDPAIVLYAQQELGLNLSRLDHILNQGSGLKGVSGLSGDMRAIQGAIAAGNDRANLAFEIYIHRLKAGIGAMVASLDGLDALVFTAGVGENSAITRQQVCEGLTFLGLKLDCQKNDTCPMDFDIATDDSVVRILVIHTEEDWAIAQACWHHLQAHHE